MSKQEAFIDTCFLDKLTRDGKDIETMKRLLDELEYVPLVHHYILRNEWDMKPFVNQLVSDGYIRVVEKNQYINDSDDEELYTLNFLDLHEQLRQFHTDQEDYKTMDKLSIPAGQDIFSYRKAGMSLADIHLILTAFYMKKPIILTEDCDIAILRSIASRRMNTDFFNLEILDIIDVLIKVAAKKDTTFKRRELLDIAVAAGRRREKHRVADEWDRQHIVD